MRPRETAKALMTLKDWSVAQNHIGQLPEWRRVASSSSAMMKTACGEWQQLQRVAEMDSTLWNGGNWMCLQRSTSHCAAPNARHCVSSCVQVNGPQQSADRWWEIACSGLSHHLTWHRNGKRLDRRGLAAEVWIGMVIKWFDMTRLMMPWDWKKKHCAELVRYACFDINEGMWGLIGPGFPCAPDIEASCCLQ